MKDSEAAEDVLFQDMEDPDYDDYRTSLDPVLQTAGMLQQGSQGLSQRHEGSGNLLRTAGKIINTPLLLLLP